MVRSTSLVIVVVMYEVTVEAGSVVTPPGSVIVEAGSVKVVTM